MDYTYDLVYLADSIFIIERNKFAPAWTTLKAKSSKTRPASCVRLIWLYLKHYCIKPRPL